MNEFDDRRRLLERLIRGGPATPDAPAPSGIGAGSRTEPASHAQRRLWFLQQLQDTHAPYTLHALQQLPFAVDAGVLERSINEIVKRHEILRTRFETRDDELLQRIAASEHVPLRCIRLDEFDVAQRDHEARRLVAREIGRRLDIERGPLIRTDLYRISDSQWLLLVVVHHIVFDWQSFPVFFSELDAIYGAFSAGRPHSLPPHPAQYAAFAREQNEHLTPERMAAELAFWKSELAGVPMLDLPLDRPRPATPSFRGAQRSIGLHAPLTAALQQRAIEARTTLFTVLLAALWAALGRLCGQQDFAIGLPVTGRDTQARQQAIGFFVDTVVVRAKWDGDVGADELIAAARAALGRSLAHRALPFETLVQHVQPVRDLSVNPLFQVGFQLMQQPMAASETRPADPARASAMFDICIDLWPQNGGLEGRVQYASDLFDAETIDLLLHAFARASAWLVQRDAGLSQLPLAEGLDVTALSMLAGESRPLQGETCLDLLDAATRRHPELTALECGATRLSYRELAERVDLLAGAIMARGIEPGRVVVVEMERSADLVCVQLALMRSRLAFACVDPGAPAERRAGAAAEVAAALVLDEREGRALLAHGGGPVPPLPVALPGPQHHDAAYVIFTSGSTGRPKGVAVEHVGLLNVALAQRHLFALGPGRRVAQLSSPTFDASIFETVLALCSGATLVIAPSGIVAGDALEQFMARSAIDTVVIPPSLLATVRPTACGQLRLVCVAGESCSADLAARYGGLEFWNLYGPTETTIWATFGRTPVGARIGIGRPVDNLRTLVVDGAGRVLPVGVAGELCISGVGVARGYVNREELTRERFVEGLPGWPERFYRTGDVVRQTRNGELVFLGRADRQVKVRGLRIELEEIEAVLREQAGVVDALVCALPLAGETTLVAYLQARGGGEQQGLVDASRSRVRGRLPAYMCPSRFVVMAEFPRRPSGKIDTSALPAPADPADTAASWAEPVGETERAVAEVMQQVLQVSRLGRTDDFFHIGGHSLAAARLVSRLRIRFKVDLVIGDVFAHTSLAALAVRVDALKAGRTPLVDEVPLVRLPRSRPVS